MKRTTNKELIEALMAHPLDMIVYVEGFGTPVLLPATEADMDVEASRRADVIVREPVEKHRKVLVIVGHDEREKIDINGWANQQPHFLKYDDDDLWCS